MTRLRKRMMEELQLRNLSPVTADTYLRAVERFARHYNLSPEKLGPEKVREYLLHLMNDNAVVASTILVNRSALRFLYVATLKQKWFDEEIARPKRRPTLPGILSAHEITRILDHPHSRSHEQSEALDHPRDVLRHRPALQRTTASEGQRPRQPAHGVACALGQGRSSAGHCSVPDPAGSVADLLSLAQADRLAVPFQTAS